MEANSPVTISTSRISIRTKGNADMIDITQRVQETIDAGGFREGAATVFVVGSTAAISTIEYEPGLRQDVPEIFDRLIPEGKYHHDRTWHDGNGHSHLRSTLIGPSLVVPFANGALLLGTWQQIVVIDFDNRAREREIVVQLAGVHE